MKIFFEKILQPRHPDPSFCSINPVFNLVPRALFHGFGVGRESPPPKAGKSAPQRTRLSRIKNSDGIFLASCSPSPLIILSTSPPFCSGSKILDSEKPTGDPRARCWPTVQGAKWKRERTKFQSACYGLVFSAPLLCFFTKLFALIQWRIQGRGRGGAVPVILRPD